MNKTLLAIGIDIGGTKINAGLVDQEGKILSTWRQPTPVEQGPEAIMAALRESITSLAARVTGDQQIIGIGVGSPGHIDWSSGKVVYCTPNMPGWTGRAIRDELQAAFDLPVFVDNDANAAAHGERWHRGGQPDDFVLLTIGTGLGSGIFVNGQMVRGRHWSAAELGHMIIKADGIDCNCGQRGCLEAYVSGSALAHHARTAVARASHPDSTLMPLGQSVTSHHVFEAADQGDQLAQSLIKEMTDNLAVGIVNIVNALDPACILIGGGVAKRGDAFLQTIRRAVRDRYSEGAPLSEEMVGLAELGEEAGLIGAAAFVFDELPIGGRQS